LGIPQTIGTLRTLEKAKPNPHRIRFNALRRVKLDM
jgi:hypothetical protein